jgi:hypothetical protein
MSLDRHRTRQPPRRFGWNDSQLGEDRDPAAEEPAEHTAWLLLTRDSTDASIDSFIELPLARRQRIDGLSPGGLHEGLFLEHFWDHLDYPVIDNVRGGATARPGDDDALPMTLVADEHPAVEI